MHIFFFNYMIFFITSIKIFVLFYVLNANLSGKVKLIFSTDTADSFLVLDRYNSIILEFNTQIKKDFPFSLCK